MSNRARYYRIHAQGAPLDISVLGEYVTEAPPALDLAIGHTFDYLRTYAERKGWLIEPLVADKEHPSHVEYKGAVYLLIWRADSLRQIIKHENGEETELTYSELPEVVRRVL